MPRFAGFTITTSSRIGPLLRQWALSCSTFTCPRAGIGWSAGRTYWPFSVAHPAGGCADANGSSAAVAKVDRQMQARRIGELRMGERRFIRVGLSADDGRRATEK